MKIHIDTSPPKKPTEGKSTQSSSSKSKSSAPSASPGTGASNTKTSSSSAGQQPMIQPKPKAKAKPIPKKLPPESKPPDDVVAARKNRSDILKERKARETNGTLQGPERTNDASTGFGPALMPYLI